MTAPTPSIVFLLDCDNTLLDNDALKADLDKQLGELLGVERNRRFWDLYESVRSETGIVNYPVVLQRFAGVCSDTALCAKARSIVMDYPFASRVYPDTPATLARLRAIGQLVIFSDGDTEYQPIKIEQSGLAAEVEGRVVIYVHKEEHLDDIMVRWPANWYVVIDDNARVLSEIERRRPDAFVTVHVRQGHYGTDPTAYSPMPDVSVEAIGDVRRLSRGDFERLYVRDHTRR